MSTASTKLNVFVSTHSAVMASTRIVPTDPHRLDRGGEAPEAVTVQPQGVTQVTLEFDTGIR